MTNKELLARIDERTLSLVKDWEDMKPVLKEIPSLKTNMFWLRTIMFSLVGLLGTIQVLAALWK